MPPPQPVGEAARHALNLLEARRTAFTDLRTLCDIVIRRSGTQHTVRGVLLVKGPGSVRLEALSPFGQPYYLVVVHGGEIKAYDAGTNEGLVGPANTETIGRLIGLPLDAEDLVAVLIGGAAPPPDLRVAEIVRTDGAAPSLDLIGATQRQRVWMDFETGAVSRVEIGGGRVPVTITYHRDGETPTGFDFNARDWVTGSVTYRDVVMGAGIDPDRFVLTLPKGAKILPLD